MYVHNLFCDLLVSVVNKYLVIKSDFYTSGAGDWNLFCTLEAPLVAAIPQDTCEWRRSYGRVTKSVSLDSSFVKFNKEGLQADNNWNLLKKPIFHIYWTDCAVSYYHDYFNFYRN